MNAYPLYNPFKNFQFEKKICFLTGKPLESIDEEIQVFPTWLMQKFNLQDQAFKMLDERINSYKQLKMPCSAEVAEEIEKLDAEFQAAFEGGYEKIKDLPQLTLFQWISRIVYGVVYCEIQAGVQQQVLTGEELNFSQVLAHKFKNLHIMMQSLLYPMQFDGTWPFKIHIFKVDNPENHFSYRDEINTLVFSLRMGDFGIVACLQDNGTNAIYHEKVLKDFENKTLHPIQFEEICARFFYSAYLFSRLPEYTILNLPDAIYVEAMPLSEMSMKPMFDNWQVKTYGQVVENFWKPWNFTLFEIIKDPDNPISFLYEGKNVSGADGLNPFIENQFELEIPIERSSIDLPLE